MQREKTKHFISALIVMLVIVTCAAATSALVVKYQNKLPFINSGAVDSAYVSNYVESVVNPSFTSISDVEAYQQRAYEKVQTELIFTSMPNEVLQMVSKVSLKQLGSVTVKDIVEEYCEHYDVYYNLADLPLPSDSIDGDTGNSPTAQEDDTSPDTDYIYREVTDSVDGKVVKYFVRERRANEK